MQKNLKFMDDSDEVISLWKNVSIEINANNCPSGTLKMIRCNNSVFFHWIPLITSNTDLFDINPGHISFTIDLYKVDSISFDVSKVEYGIIEFFFKDFKVFPRFLFNDYGKLAVYHLIQFLLNQKIATVCTHNDFMILISTNISEIENLPEKTVTSTHFITLVDHWKSLDQLGVHEQISPKTPISYKYLAKNKIKDDKNILNQKNLCFENGIAQKDRCKIWPLFLFNNTKYHMEDPKNLTRQQNEEISSTIDSIYNDSKRLARTEKRSESFLHFLRDILCSFSLFYPNSTFQSGLCEILSIFIDVFVNSFQEEKSKVIMNDGRILEMSDARYYIFCLFISFISKNESLYVQIQSRKNYRSFVDRINAVIEYVDPSAFSVISFYQMSKNLNFLTQSIYLLYSHDFDCEKLLRFWDSIISFSDEKETTFVLFFHAAMAIFLFNPMFMLNKENSFDVFQVADEMKKKADLEILIQMTVNLIKIIKDNTKLEWIFQPLDEEKEFLDYKPTYLKIVSE